ncbi:hypothetical protein EMPS_04539 [Entomortierella parvispora]|uniref:SH3 domain-containing protein n=1 Tax=Entomortierella parvispora TaxID=205924 RepID=A0A9P3H9F6_9FUNG|nr:hypothetical protein EMPS_04539 [Entomortierella parvispora]
MRFNPQSTLAVLAFLALLSLSTEAHPLPNNDNDGKLNQLELVARATRSSYFRKRQFQLPPLSSLSPPPSPPAHNISPVAAPPAVEPPVVPAPVQTSHPKSSPVALPPSTQNPDPEPSTLPGPSSPHPQPTPTIPNPNPAPHPNPSPSSSPPSNPNPNPSPSKTTHSSSNAHSASAPVASPGSSSTDSASPSVSPSSDDGSGVPTKVSEKVFIGLGIVGGLIVFALGGVAFCRHRRKKNLATALLQQTAQFNHNNPYAKISEASKAKESLPMTPTKPLGTFSVRSTYTPALADEIEINLGDSVTILQEYDDGWCMGVNNTRGGIKGVFPRHCLEGQFDNSSQYGGGGGGGGEELGYYPPNPGFTSAINKRMSSIPPQGWHNQGQVNGYTPGGAYGDYPAPQYNMPPPNQGGYYQGGY